MNLLSTNPNNQTQSAEYLFALPSSSIIPRLVVETAPIEHFQIRATDNKGGIAIQNYDLLIQSHDNNNYDPVIISEPILKASTSLELLATADLIFICTPIHLIVPTLQKLTPYLKPQAIVTDVGSVKGAIVANCSRLCPNFVGSHPMAGKTEQGINAAQLGLFVNTPYVITPLESTPNACTRLIS